jgi:hypothetical protein
MKQNHKLTRENLAHHNANLGTSSIAPMLTNVWVQTEGTIARINTPLAWLGRVFRGP